MAITENWNIRSRAHICAATGATFAEGDLFYTALYDDPKSGELLRKDFSLAGWAQEMATPDTIKPFSFWKATYEPPKTEAKAEVVEKEGAPTLLRRLIEEDNAGTENTRYILAVMLERKKILRHTGNRDTEDATFLVYENPKNGEVYIIRDPELRLDQVEAVQKEVSLLLGAPGSQPAPQEPAPVPTEPEPAAEPEIVLELESESPSAIDEPAQDTPEPAATESDDAASRSEA